MLALINTNRMRPAIAPVGLDYAGGAARAAGIEVAWLDLGLADDPSAAAKAFFKERSPRLVGLTLRNADDSFWPSAASFVEPLRDRVRALRRLTKAPIVLGGAGFSIFASEILDFTGADYGIRGDGEAALPALYRAVSAGDSPDRVPGLVTPRGANPPAWDGDGPLNVPTNRDVAENAAYFRLGGQIGLETKRGCPLACDFCADPIAKGARARCRPPADTADEAEALLRQGVDVFHLCDGEFNVPVDHARAVCEEWIRRRLGERVRWYAYLSVTPFDAGLARAMRQAGCVGINFTGPAATPTMLRAYGVRHRVEDLAAAVRAARAAGITTMVDLMLGGPGETPTTVRQAVDFLRILKPDCVGAALGVRLYPGLPLTRRIAAEGPLETNPAIRRRYEGPVNLLWPTYYIAAALGRRPAAVVRDILAGDPRFFEPPPDEESGQKSYNYNDNAPLVDAIAAGARGAYWDILRQVRQRSAT
ncbi:MAG TPA: radical SAM protein [Kiritimatiellia bacterium]|nr:radical SAM protein [Kiritimatiellia bacterium]HRZ11340.1 radical SAM protein [Kiritimatiellia bacterium]HSA17109.1 radical SAM protein [Kiritimatiellia bacterium]